VLPALALKQLSHTSDRPRVDLEQTSLIREALAYNCETYFILPLVAADANRARELPSTARRQVETVPQTVFNGVWHLYVANTFDGLVRPGQQPIATTYTIRCNAVCIWAHGGGRYLPQPARLFRHDG